MFDDLLKKIIGLGSNAVNSVKKKAQNIIQKPVQYFNPTSNAGNNFWSTPVVKGAALAQDFFQNNKPVTIPKLNLQLSMDKPAPEFKINSEDSFEKKAAKTIANIPSSFFNSITKPVVHVGQDIGQMFADNNHRLIGGKPELNYNTAKSGITRLAMQGASAIDKSGNIRKNTQTKTSVKEVLGNAAEPAELALNMFLAGKAPEAKAIANEVVKIAGKKGIKKAFLELLKEGGKIGAGYGVLTGLQNNRSEQDNSKYALQLAEEIGINAVGGAAISGVVGSLPVLYGAYKGAMMRKHPKMSDAEVTVVVKKQLRDAVGKFTSKLKYSGLTPEELKFVQKVESKLNTSDLNGPGLKQVSRNIDDMGNVLSRKESIVKVINPEDWDKYKSLLKKVEETKLKQQSGAIDLTSKVETPSGKGKTKGELVDGAKTLQNDITLPKTATPDLTVTNIKKPIDPNNPFHNEVDKAIEMMHTKKVGQYQKGIETANKILNNTDGYYSPKDKKWAKDYIAFWTGPSIRDEKMTRLQELANLTPNRKSEYTTQYLKEVKKAISQGYDIPESVTGQFPELKKAFNARARYDKGYATSFANRSAAINEATKADYGFKVKRQDGKAIDEKQIRGITTAAHEFEQAVGPIKDIIEKLDLTIAHTNGKYPFLRSDASGLYHSKDRTITVGMDGIKAFAHELAHAIDHSSDTMSSHAGKTGRMLKIGNYTIDGVDVATTAKQLMNGSKWEIERLLKVNKNLTPEQKTAQAILKGRIGKYFDSEEEIFARMVEQYVSTKNGGRQMGSESELAEGINFYHDSPAYWTKENFDKLMPMIEKLLGNKISLTREKEGLKTPKSFGGIYQVDQPQVGLSDINVGGVTTQSKVKVPRQAEQIIQETISGTNPKSVEKIPKTQSTPSLEQLFPETPKVDKQIPSSPDSASSAFDSIIQEGKKQIGTLKDEPKKSWSEHFSDFYTDWVDRYNPVNKLTDIAEKYVKKQGAEIRPEYNPKYVIRRFLGMGGIAEQRFQSELIPIIKKLDDQGVNKSDLDLYLKSRRDVNLSSRGVKGSSADEANSYIRALEGKYGDTIKGIADELYSYQNNGLQDLVDAGFLSPKSKKIIQEKNVDYVPFQRVMDEVDEFLGMPSKVAQQTANPLKKMEGSDKKVYSPLESIIINTYKQRAAIEKNRVAQSVVGLQKIVPEIKFPKSKTLGNDSIAVWENGKRNFYKVGEDIAKSMRGMNEETMNSWAKIFTAPAALLRQGATGRNPDFMLPNIVRDQLDAAVNSKYGYVPVVDYVRGLAHIVKKNVTGSDEMVDAWMKSGGAQSFASLSGRKSVKEMFDEKKATKGLFGWLSKGLDTMGKYSEEPTRIGLFSKAMKKTGNSMLSMFESREGTMDFSRMGAKMKVANSIVPFLNVGVQGFDKILRNAKENPAKFAMKMSLYGVLPTVMTTLYNVQNHPEEYAEIPQYVKDGNFVFVSGRNEKGTIDYFTIPKGNVITLVANPVENFISYLANTNKQSFAEFATSFLSSSLPVIGDGQTPGEVAIKTVGSNLPQAIKPITENLMNKSFFKYNTKTDESKEIVPYYLNKKAPGDQSYEFTPSMYKVIGKVINVSPLKVQNLMEGYLAGYTKIPANIIEGLKNMSEGKEVNKNQMPIIRRFMQETYPTESTKTKKQATETPLIPQAKAAEDTGLFGSIFKPNEKRKKAEEKAVDNFIQEKSKKVDIQTLPEKTKYEKAVKEKAAFKIVDDIIDSTDLTDSQKGLAFQKIGIKKEDAEYYLIAKKTVDERYAYVQDLVDKNGFKLKSLIPLRRTINGQKVLSDAVITAMVDDELISKSDGKALKKIKDEAGKVKGGSGSGGITKTKLKTFKKKVGAAYTSFYKSQAKSQKMPELDFSFFNSSTKTKRTQSQSQGASKISESDVKLSTSVKPVPIEQLFKAPNTQTANLSKAKSLVTSSKGGGFSGKKLKLSKSSIRSLFKK